ncbi:MAG: glycoside hydrolase family 13 protein [Clostridiales bacterium]|nr:glycoside hydrolase family 13 protein [Clostridiales bacterium]
MFRHASRSEKYRIPFGALKTGSDVKLVFDASKDSTEVVLCYSYGLYGFSYHEEPMRLIHESRNHDRYEVDMEVPSEPCILFYWFRVTMNDSDLHKIGLEGLSFNKPDQEHTYVYYVFDECGDKGNGKVYPEPPRIGVEEDKYPFAWQITVYEENFRTPDFLKGALMYQIFPDRFSRDSKFNYEEMTHKSPRSERIYHEDWNEEVDIYGKPETGYLACDFYGGSLDGIAEKLDYIKSLGIDVLYLNPIFEARSSHRYDTADYLNVDPILGGNEAFERLSKACDEKGIKIVIDGVFSHTGADSRYFNKFDRYEGVGAFRSYKTGEESKFRSWYKFIGNDKEEPKYESWWGFPDLPNVDENDLSYRRFIFGKDGVVDTWIKRGASGLRLDVSDELPDSFIRQMRTSVRKYSNGNGCVIGEVWEDASNKCSYGSYRDFMLGRTHDSVMGYTFRIGLLNFLTHTFDAKFFDSYMEGFRERYPSESYYSMMNLISSHDVPRAINILVKKEDPGDRELQKDIFLSEEEKELGMKLMKLAYSFQIGYIGSPCLYYGDEILMEGFRDPFNRRTYPWEKVDDDGKKMLSFVREISRLRVENPVLRTGLYKTIYAEENAIVFERYLDKENKDAFGKYVGEGAKRIVLLINNNDSDFLRFDTRSFEAETCETKEISEGSILKIKEGSDTVVSAAPRSSLFLIYE